MDVANRSGWKGVTASSVSLLAGVLMVQWWPSLPSAAGRTALLALLALISLLAWRRPRLRPLLWACFGIAWALLHGAAAMQARLPRALEGQDITVIGRVLDLPADGGEAVRFQFRVAEASREGEPLALRGRVRLAWYRHDAALHACDRWQLTLRLKRPRGMLNPGGADSERTALERGIVANGYVRESKANLRLGKAPWCVDRLRARLAAGIDARVGGRREAALLRALAVGDTRGLDDHDWAIARANGVSHLLAISGFHIGVAAAFGVWFVWGLYALFPRLALRVPRIQAQAAAALLAASFYGALAGMGLPTLRTLLMIAVVVAARALRRHAHGGHALALAMMAMLLADPLAVLSAGFWLSFVGVAFLILCLDTRWPGLRGFVRELTSAQLVMTLALLPLTLWFFGQASLVGALANLVAVPVVSFLIVPLALIAVLALLFCPPAAAPVLWLAARVVQGQWWLLDHTARWPGAQWFLPAVQPWALLLGMLGALWLLAPRGTPSRWFGGVLFLPLLLPAQTLPPTNAFEAWVLDVGQGLSVVVRTRHHVMVYDTGARYPSGFDVGAAAVVPSLHALGVRHVDRLVVSHADNDHAGGTSAVLAAFPGAARLAGEPARMHVPMPACTAGESWRWDGVSFSVLSPEPGPGEGNDRSCVILVDGGSDRLLLTGDITRRIEPAVAAAVAPGRPVIVVVPHHGSKTSSSEAFIQALQPSLAVVSAGWRNRFGHPHPAVVKRYAAAGVPMLNTATSGAVVLAFPAGRHRVIERRERLRQRRYWREQ